MSCGLARRGCKNPAPAFTLIEALAVIAVVGVLLGMLLAAIGVARKATHETVMLSNVRDTGMMFDLYTQAYDRFYPFHALGEPFQDRPPESGPPSLWTDDPWAMRYAWPTVMHRVAPWSEHYRTWAPPWSDAEGRHPWQSAVGGIRWPVIAYSCSFTARPEAWSVDDRELGDALRGVRATEVLSPSGKVLLFDATPASESNVVTRAVGLADLSADRRSDADATPPVQNRINSRDPMRYHDTRDGVRGIDTR